MDTDAERVIAAVIERERERRAALVEDDMPRLAQLLTDDLVHVHTTGIVHDKNALLHHAGQFLRFYNVVRGDLLVRVVAPDVAVMTGGMTNVVGRRGTEEQVTVEAFVTQVWVLRKGQWQIASFHAVVSTRPLRQDRER
jgi:ketosteroid isomerase-like protein